MDAILESFVAFATELAFDDIPLPVVMAAKERLIDSLGCAIGAHDTPTVKVARAVATQPAQPAFAGRMLGTGEVAAADAAGFVNSCMIRTLDFNDTYPGVHPSDTIGGLLAIGAQRGASGRDLLTAMVVAYEVFIRLQRTAQFRERGWDQGAGAGSASAAAVANLLKLTPDVTRHAIALATVNNMPLRATRAGQLSMWKGAATASAVRSSIFCTQLAQLGMTGPEAPFSGRHGLAEQISGPIELPAFGHEADCFFLPRVRLKYWPVAYNMQLAVWAAIELRRQVAIENIAAIEVETYWQAWSESGSEPAKWDPRTQGTADHSLPYIMASTLRHGTIGPEAFEPDAYLDPTIRPLMALISARVADDIQNEFPETIRMRATARDKAGRLHQAEIVNPPGHETSPMSHAGIGEKFARLCDPVLGGPRTIEALDYWWAIDRSPDISEGFDLLEIPAASGRPACLCQGARVQ